MTKLLAPVHPGEILKEEFMRPLSLSANALANAVRVPPNRISAIVNGERGLTADTALRLARAFGTAPEFWLNLQTQYELD
jgi:addiction module HigA family antidote